MPEIELNPPLMRQVGLLEQTWDSRKAQHKMGKVYPGDIVALDAQNGDWYRIDPGLSSAPDLKPPHNADSNDLSEPFAYTEHWIKDRPDGLFLAVDAEIVDEPVDEPADEPASEDPTDAEIGAAFRLLVKAFWG